MSWNSGGGNAWNSAGNGGDWDATGTAGEWKDSSGADRSGGNNDAGPSAGNDMGAGTTSFAASTGNDGNDGNDGGNGGFTGGGDDSGARDCYNCGEVGHSKADCPNPSVFTGTCRSCNKEGHMSKDCPDRGPPRCSNCRREGHFISDCPDPLVCPRCGKDHMVKECPEPMKCHYCQEEGHLGKDCPTYVETCKNCGEAGHKVMDCKAPRKVDRSGIRDVESTEAWTLLQKAIDERDVDDIKEAVQMYVKSQPDMTFADLERALRAQSLKLWLIPLEKTELAATLTNMDLQGNLDKKYTINYRFDSRPQRPREREGWPANEKEIFERLADAGEVVPRLVPKCTNCNELGHISKSCPQEKMDTDRTVIKCYNCDAEGHRVRDCPVPRVDKFACKNCGKGGHKVAECPEPRTDIDCRKCGETGHMSRDCPQGGGNACHSCGQEGHMSRDCTEPRKPKCRNCDEFGHMAKECLKPRDMSRIKCSNCQEMGHFKSRCANPMKPEDDDADAFGATDGGGGGGGGGFDNPTGGAAEVTTGWNNADSGTPAWETSGTSNW